MKKILGLFVLGLFILTACEDDPEPVTPVFDAPSITAPGVSSVEANSAIDVTFTVSSPGGYASSAWTFTGGSAAPKSEPDAGATSGNVVATFTAGAEAGAASLTLTVTDAQGKSSSQTAVIDVTAEPIVVTPDPVQHTGVIEADETWTSDRFHILNNKVYVAEGVTLTIEAGTIIKGSPGTGSLASALVVAMGGKINAVGTASSPIIFTSTSDNIELGSTSGTNLTTDDSGLWGGLIVLGKAKISASDDDGIDVVSAQIEGIPADVPYGSYGGSDDADNSGTLSYISIRHGGSLLGEGNEINGLTLGGVGSGTSISYVEVVANKDDGIEFFGGSVDCSYCMTAFHDDDGIDIDQSYSGSITNSVSLQGPGSDHALEIDGPEGSMEAGYTLDGITLIGNGGTAKSEIADFRKSALGANKNVYAYNFPPAGDGDISLSSGSDATYAAGTLSFENWEIILNAADTDVLNIMPEISGTRTMINNPSGSAAVTVVTAGSQTVGATLAGFDWTWSKANGLY